MMTEHCTDACLVEAADGSLWPTMDCLRAHMPVDDALPTGGKPGDLSRQRDGSVCCCVGDRWTQMKSVAYLPPVSRGSIQSDT